jgi:hypothetical protein
MGHGAQARLKGRSKTAQRPAVPCSSAVLSGMAFAIDGRPGLVI